MNRSDQNMEPILHEYRKLVLRWNPQINLISRQDTASRLGVLIGQCREAWELLTAKDTSSLAKATGLWYFDLGSGGGLPGAVWHLQMAAVGIPVWTLLVEPREKRAWFLERVAHLIGPESLEVEADRWGELTGEKWAAKVPVDTPSHILISMKALRLPDSAVLEGLAPFLEHARGLAEGGGPWISLTIARFYPPKQEWNDELADELDIPVAGQLRQTRSHAFQAEGGRVLSPATLRGASLILSLYRISIS